MLEDQKPRGRPRKWATEAERKRAYRQRRAAELADPQALREEANSLRAAASSARAAEKRAKEQAASWRTRAERAERRTELARQRTRVAERAAQRARAERNQAQRLLRNKMQWSRDARPLRNDPDSLLALIADLRRQLEEQRHELAQVKQLLVIAERSDHW
jgi:AT-hook transcription factor